MENKSGDGDDIVSSAHVPRMSHSPTDGGLRVVIASAECRGPLAAVLCVCVCCVVLVGWLVRCSLQSALSCAKPLTAVRLWSVGCVASAAEGSPTAAEDLSLE